MRTSMFLTVAALSTLVFGCAREARPVKASAATPASASAGSAGSATTADAKSDASPVNIAGIGAYCGKLPSDARSRELYTKACAQGDGEGCGRVGGMYLCGNGVVANASVGASMLDKGCSMGAEESCNALAALLLDGTRLPRDVPRARKLLSTSCDAGMAGVCETYAVLLLSDREEAAQAKAVTLFEKACDGGRADACANLAVVYQNAVGGKTRDSGRAYSHAKKACEGKSEHGCTILGILHLQGDGAPGAAKDEALALKLFDGMCEAGRGDACYYSAKCYYEGLGTRSDASKAEQRLDKACTIGHGAACRLLADLAATRNAPPMLSPVGPAVF